jgi:3-oxoadipate enol-lactonase
MPYVALPDLRLYYEVHGPPAGSAPAIVFAHGMGGSHLSWWQQVPHFAPRYTCVTFDHRGFGRSPEAAGGPSGAAFANDLRAILDDAGIARAHLVAQSMGGWTCLRFAQRWPERVQTLVMSNTHGGLTTPEIAAAWKPDAEAVRQWGEGIHPAAGARMYREQPALHFLYREIAALNPERGLAEMGAILAAAGTLSPADVAGLRVPVLFVTSDEDAVIPARVIELAATHVPGARLERVPAAGHSVYFERAAAFNALVDAFLGQG